MTIFIIKIIDHVKYFIAAFLIFLLSFNDAHATLEEKTINVDQGQIKYYQIGIGQPVLLIHGLFANKEQWLKFVLKLIQIDEKITQKYQFIIPDLPGYGHSANYPIEVYNLDNNNNDNNTQSLNQVRVIHDFVSQLHIVKPFNIAGNSMGGLLMTLYAIHYPRDVKSLAYIGSPLGISDVSPQFVNSGIRRGYNPFIPTTIAEVKNELRLLLVNYAAITPSDEYIKTKMIPFTIRNFQRLTAAFNMVNISYYHNYLTHKLPIKQAALVLWGNKDYIFSRAENAKTLCDNLASSKKCTWQIIVNAGHLLMLEDSITLDVVAKYYLDFLSQNQTI